MSQVMSWEDWAAQDGVGLAGLMRAGEITAAEVAAQAAAAIAKVNPALCGVVEVFDDAVADPGVNGADPAGIFAGLPFLLKDLGPTLGGRLQEQGSHLMKGNRPAADSFLVSKMKAAGLNIIGRSTTPEFGCCSSAENPTMYVTRNPWDTGFTSCGSSAGAGVMTGAGAVPMAHGSDGGGSIRIPAGCCGVLGLKPSRGVFSISPYGSDFASVVSSQGCLTRSVRDSAAFFDACRGGAPGEFMPFWQPDEPYLSLVERDPKPLKIALSHEWGPYSATPHIAAELVRAGEFLQSLGHHVEAVVPPVDFARAYAAQTTCYITNFAQTVRGLLAAKGLDAPPADLVEPMNIRIWEQGLDAGYSQRADMQLDFNATARAFGAFYQDWDIILTPTTARETPPIGTTEYLTTTDNPSALDWFGNLWGFFAYTPLDNLCGTPGLSMPLAKHANGLPLGIQAHAAQGGDGLLLQLAAQVERALGGRWNGGALPAVHVTRD
ncbi:amidase [Frigidibacter sp. MR17.24]|uniref:amidase n=1 Tax=Frigidibacter sp. MR17.24 TaxID=3127345 RepID=UPI003012E6A1